MVLGISSWLSRVASRTQPQPRWRLASVDGLSPYTEYRPSRACLMAIKPGDLVQLGFHAGFEDASSCDFERLWVEVAGAAASGCRGVLRNAPQRAQGLKRGDAIAFCFENVLRTVREDPEGDQTERYRAACLATASVAEGRSAPGLLHRLTPVDHADPDRRDSGWRMRAAGEPNPDVPDGYAVLRVSLGELLDRDDRFVDLLDALPGASFAWDADSGSYQPAPFPGEDQRTLH